MLALMMVLSLAACGGKDDKQPSGNNDNPGTSQQSEQNTDDSSNKLALGDIDKDNWQEYVKKFYALDIELPDGWSLKNVEVPYSHGQKVVLEFNVGGDTTYRDFGETIFAATQKASTKEAMGYESVEDVGTNNIAWYWFYKPELKKEDGKDYVHVGVNYNNMESYVQFELLFE